MRILVCISNVPDTTTKVKFSTDQKSFDDAGVQWIINPWDELALTRAMELKEDASNPVSNVTVVTVGPATVEPTLRKALAIGADDAIRVDAISADAHFVASQIAAVAGSGDFAMILCGIESSDYNGSAVGGMIAEIMGVPSVSAVSGLTLEGDELLITRDIDGGKEEVSVPAPFVGVVQKGIAKAKAVPEFAKTVEYMEEASNALFDLTMFFAGAGKSGDFLAPIYNACKFLELMGDVVVGHFLLDAAVIANEKLNAMYEEKGLTTIGKQKGLQREDQEAAFYAGKVASAKFFANENLTTVKARCQAIKDGDKSAMELVDLGFTV